jgi:methyl-accepting chemotaxis protein
MVEQATAAAHSLREETNALSALMAQFRIGDAMPGAVRRPAATGKANPVHAVQRKVANFVGAGRMMGGTAQPTLASASRSWEEF